ncbi:MAG: hypothetical protein AABN33_19470 [Acidobacteriota bacterium]
MPQDRRSAPWMILMSLPTARLGGQALGSLVVEAPSLENQPLSPAYAGLRDSAVVNPGLRGLALGYTLSPANAGCE